MPFTVVSFHAHPDDEVLYTGGTLARAAADGHRVVVVVATDGGAGRAGGGPDPAELAQVRAEELDRAAAALGCAHVIRLGFRDSGYRTSPPPDAFSRIDVARAAAPLIEVLQRERADVLTVYDRNGGYGHPDHRQVHTVGTWAAREAGTPVVLEATVDRSRIRLLAGLITVIPRLLPDVKVADYGAAYAARGDITHRVDVTSMLATKRAALAAHASQASGGDGGSRTVKLLLGLPRPLFRLAVGTEWFVEQGRPRSCPVDDIFASLR